MKKILLLFALSALIAFPACKKDGPGENVPKETDKDIDKDPDKDPDDPDPETDPFKLSYSNLTVEEHKKDIEASGIAFIGKISDLPDQAAAKAIQTLIELEPDLPGGGSTVNAVYRIGQAASKSRINDVVNSLATLNGNGSATNSLSDFYGIYSYDKASGSFTETESDDRFEIRFPSSSGGSSNNAVLTIKYTASEQAITIDGETTELPSSVSASLKIDGGEALSISSEFNYQSDGVPVKSEITLLLGSYKFELAAASENSEVVASFELLKGAETLLKLRSTTQGSDFNLAAIEDAEYIEEILHEANATFEIMDIQLAGFFDIRQYGNAGRNSPPYPQMPDYEAFFYEGIYDDPAALEKAQAAYGAAMDEYTTAYQAADRQRAEEEAANLNAHTKFVAINTTSNTLIAKVEFKFMENSENYCYQEYDPQSDAYRETCHTSIWYSADPVLVFKDESRVSFSTFGDTGFEQFIKELEKFAEKFE